MKEIMQKLDEYFYTTNKEQLIEDDVNGDIILANWEIYKLYEYVKKLDKEQKWFGGDDNENLEETK